MMKTLDKNTLLKALANGIIAWFVLALLLCVVNDESFLEMFLEPYTIYAAFAAFVGCCIGYSAKKKKENHK